MRADEVWLGPHCVSFRLCVYVSVQLTFPLFRFAVNTTTRPPWPMAWQDALARLVEVVTRAYAVNPAICFEVFIHKVREEKRKRYWSNDEDVDTELCRASFDTQSSSPTSRPTAV